MTLHPNATYSTRNPRTWGDLQSKAETDLADWRDTPVDLTRPADDPDWGFRAVDAELALAELVLPEQLADFLATVKELPAKERYCRTMAQVHLEKARRLQEDYEVDNEPLGGWM